MTIILTILLTVLVCTTLVGFAIWHLVNYFWGYFNR